MTHLELEHEPGCMHKCSSKHWDAVGFQFNEDEDDESTHTGFEGSGNNYKFQ